MLQYTYKYVDGKWRLEEANKMSGIDEKNGWSIPHWPYAYDGEWTDEQYNRSQYCQHKWVDTGMRKTFCKECDVEGDYDPMTGKITVIHKEVTKK